MARISFKQKLDQASTVLLSFLTFTYIIAKDKSRIVIFELEEMIPRVRGSQSVEYDGKLQPVVANNVVELKVREDDIDDTEFFWDDVSDTGGYKGTSLFMDVAKNSGEVWLTSKSFAQAGNDFRSNIRNERFSKMFGVKAPVTGGKEEKELVDANAKIN